MELQAHQMIEAQVTMTLKGHLEKPQCTYASRAGAASYRNGTQKWLSQAINPALERDMKALKQNILQRLERFTSLNAQISMQALIRNRHIPSIQGYFQDYQGFWGQIEIEDSPPSIFGSDEEGKLVFRRGPWEDWPYDLPKFEALKPGVPLILSPYCGTLLHETVGHAVEADYLCHSPLLRFQGEQITHQELSLSDRPDLSGFPGSMSHDDCGQPATETRLLHNGFLVGDLDRDKGVWRRASYRDLPQVRATNCLTGRGSSDPNDWMEQETEAYYLSWIKSGSWHPASPHLKIMTGPIFHLKKGQPIAKRDWIFLSLTTIDLLKRIRGVGNDLCMDPVVHWCMKKNQATPMGLGSTSLLLSGEHY